MRQPDASDRYALLGQLDYLVDELEAQLAVHDAIPAPLWSAAPVPGDLSLLGMYGTMAAREERVYGPVAEALMLGESCEEPSEEAVRTLEDWDTQEPSRLVERIVHARRGLIDVLRDVPGPMWERTGRVDGRQCSLARYAYDVTQRDADTLRAIGIRLYEAQLSSHQVRSL